MTHRGLLLILLMPGSPALIQLILFLLPAIFFSLIMMVSEQ